MLLNVFDDNFSCVISAHKIHISEACKAILQEHGVHVLTKRGEMEIKVHFEDMICL